MVPRHPTLATVDGSEAKRQEQVTQLRTRQRALLERIDLLQQRVIDLLPAIPEEPLPSDVDAQLKSLQAALTFCRAEAADVKARLERLRLEQTPDWVQTFAYTVGTNQLPSRPDLQELFEFSDADIDKTVRAAARELGTVAVLIGDEDPTNADPPDDEEGILYRIPRPAQLGSTSSRRGLTASPIRPSGCASCCQSRSSIGCRRCGWFRSSPEPSRRMEPR